MKRAYLLATVFLLSCSMAPELEKPEINTPEKFKTETSRVNRNDVISSKWWKTFNDTVLDTLVEKAIHNNLDLKIAIERVHQFAALFDLGSSGRWPQLNVNGSLRKQEGKMINNFGFGGQQGQPAPEYFDVSSEQYSLKLGLMFNLDIWGKFKSMSDAANANFRAAKYDLQTAYSNLIGQTVSLYFEIDALDRQTYSAKISMESYKKGYDLQTKRYTKGIRSKLNMELAKQQFAGAKIHYEKLNTALHQLKYSLSVLIGEYPNLDQKTNRYDVFSDLAEIPSGVPSELLKRRADIQAAEARLQAACSNIGAARADFFPQMAISADAGYIANSLGDLFKFDENLIDKTLGVQLTQPVFSGFSKTAALDQRWAEYEIAKHRYQKTVLGAFQEVENALIAIQSSHVQLKAGKLQSEGATKSLAIMKKRYRRGVSSFEQYLESERNYQNSQNNFIGLQKEYLLSRVKLHNALGGEMNEAL